MWKEDWATTRVAPTDNAQQMLEGTTIIVPYGGVRKAATARNPLQTDTLL